MNFKNYSLFCLIWTLLSIFWGAWVRLSLSGDACGKSWPLCESQLFPENTKALIEWLHRASSGLAFLFVLLLALWAYYPKSQSPLIRFFSLLSFVFILIEAFIGALLVLKGWVALNTDQVRVISLALHSVNSVFLVGALTLNYKACFWQSPHKPTKNSSKASLKTPWKKQIHLNKPLIYFVLAFPLLALTGNIASLAGQLFPASSLVEAWLLDFLPSSHISLKIRFLHPLLAVLFLAVLLRLAFDKKQLWKSLLAVFFVVLVGFSTLLSLSPLVMKLIHLFCAYFLWIFLLNEAVRPA